MVSPARKSQNKNKNTNPTIAAKKKRGLLLIFFVFIAVIFYFLFFMNVDKTPEQLIGSWVRTDGPYTIEINKVEKEGVLKVRYLNPDPINIGSSGWKVQDKKVQVFVELRDKNYPGSIYKLTLDKKTNTLNGTYYQAVAGQTFEVRFARKE